jgi:HK97 gp10 family phage protein
MAFVVNLSGLKDIQDSLKAIDGKLRQDVGDEINASALNIQNSAKRLAPVDLGFLRNNIALVPIGDLTFAVEARAKYSPYIEFGTGGEVNVPAGYEDLAIRFKGKGIRRVNIKPQPFLIPSYETEKPKLIDRLKKLLDAKS